MGFLNEGERKKMDELKEKLIQANSTSEVLFFEQEIHKVLDTVEERLKKYEEELQELLQQTDETKSKYLVGKQVVN